ncbi:MAG TPA: FAD-dependent oxidoreductase [Solirubrobacteraceae bacterium]|nr:FAD-dependent oxidoreductase [Solirubrobacteraceae bacterium]
MPVRVIVVGAGIVGSCVALRLAQGAAEVTLLDASTPGAGTTGTSFAWIDASHPALDGYLDLNIAGVRAWHDVAADFGDPDWLTITGTLTWESDPDRAAALEARIEELAARGFGARALDAGDVAELEPDLRLDGLAGKVAYYPEESFLFTRPALADLLARAVDAGVSLRTGATVTGFATSGEAVTGVQLSTGETLGADAVVTCVGRWTEDVLRLAGVELPMTAPEPAPSPAVGLLVLTTPTVARLRRVVVVDGLMIRPDGAGRLLLHGDEQDARMRADTPMTPAPAEALELVELARGRLRGSETAALESARIGIRALPADHLPAVGWTRDGLYAVVSHSGVTIAPALGELVREELLEGEQVDALERFRPARFERAMT